MRPKLYGYWRSSASWRVRWAFELKKLDYEYVPVNLLNGENRTEVHLARNPTGALPVLECAPGTFLSQSMSILLWMEENFAKAPMIFGRDRTYRYKILELCELINADTAPLQVPKVQKVHSDDSNKRIEWAKTFIHLGLEAFESLSKPLARNYSVGDEISAADLFLIPQMYNAKRYGMAFEPYPTLKRVWENCMATAECQKSSPEQQVDAVLS